jgi:hypothetical protein
VIPTNEHEKLIELLISKGFTEGWALQGETLIVWEHDAEPPAPLTRPK